MALSSIDNFSIENDTNESNKEIQKYLNDEEFNLDAFVSVQLFEYVMNSDNSSIPLRRCPSNVSDVSAISSFSVSNKATNKNLYSDYHVGDYVYVDSISGVKYGVIRYAGYVDFAKGYWFGIELSEPNGKNNGTIKGKVYFTCPDNHGIFTQSSKISKSPPIKKTHRLSSTGSVFGSRESIGSSIFLKRNGLNTSQESLRSCVSGVSAITGVFKQTSSKNLKNQLATSSSKTSGDKVENLSKELSYLSVHESEQLVKSKIELAKQKHELEEQCKQYENEINELKIAINEEKRISKELINQLEEEKKRMEMLEFRMEEEKITRMHLEEEVQKKEKLIDDFKRKSEQDSTLKNDENEIEMFELQEDLIKKEEKILQLESSLKTKQNENSNLLERTREFEQTLKVFEQSQKNYLTKIDDLNLKIKKYELEKAQLEDALNTTSQDKSHLTNVSIELATKTKELDGLKDQLTKKSNEIVMLKDELERINKQLVSLENEKFNLKKELETTKNNLTKQIKILEENKRSINEQLNKGEKEQNEERNQMVEQLNLSRQQLNEFKAKLEEFKNAEQKSKANLKTKEENLNKIEKELASSKSEIEQLRTDLTKLTNLDENKEIELQKFKSECQRLAGKIELNKTEKQQLENELDELKAKLEQKEGDINSFNKKKLQYQNEMEMLIRDLSNEKEKNRELLMNNNQINQAQKDQLTNTYKELDLIKKAHDKVNIQLEEQINLVNDLQINYYQMELKAKNLEKANHELSLIIEKFDQNKEEELNSLRDENSKVMNEVEKKLEGYEDNLKKLHDGLVEKDVELNSLQLQHQQMIEKIRLDSSLKCSELEKEIINLKCQLNKEQKELIDYKANQEEQLHNDDKDLYESQIKFLNSVIVDMELQNVKLKNKVKMLEEIRQEEMNLFKPTGNLESDNNPFSFKPVKNQLNSLNSKEQVTHQLYFKTTQRATRLFCSVCGQMDHIPEECPQNLIQKEDTFHTRLNQSKKEPRAYCVRCELFSHWTYECPKEQN